tara:strand:- start:134 stop:403 length:270 start_codon:yes stop_codon:yes gene_type:complete
MNLIYRKLIFLLILSGFFLSNLEARQITIESPDQFLNVEINIYKDGINADRNAMDYKLQKKVFNKNTKLDVSMSDGGGFSIIFEFPKNG